MNKLLLPANDIATTHALLRRATWGLWYRCERVCATTHALLRRATPLAVEPLDDALATTHALLRRATADVCVVAGAMGATTHALLRRATQHGTFLLFVLWCYNSRSPAESDVIERSIFTLSNRYNSRSPTESDLPGVDSMLHAMDATTPALSCGERRFLDLHNCRT